MPETQAQKLSTRFNLLAGRIERLKEQFTSNGVNAPSPHPANDPLPQATVTSNWEADDLGDADLSLDALEKRVVRLAHG